MKKWDTTTAHGFALKEVLIIIFLICSLVSLGLAWSRHFGSRKPLPECMAKARNIAAAIKAYSEQYEGWTYPDAHYYVKEFGYKLNSEPGYYGEPPPWYSPSARKPTESQKHAASIRDFSCPEDSVPKLNKHGIPSSYQVAPAFAGQCLWDHSKPAEKVLAVFEKDKRHRPGRLDSKLDRYYIYADLHGELGGEGQEAE
ncbi:MAG: hypothetical protein HYU36_21570 [Planctomycetes bacterium]|nr:hypothetical protein [Planctomycetota bacterium]